MAHNVVNFVEGYVLGSENGGNLKPLNVTENGIYYPADYDCNGFSHVDVNVQTKIKKIDMLPTWGEVIFDDSWSVKIKKSDEIENTDQFAFDTEKDNIYLKTYQRTWTVYYCVYNSDRLLFGNMGTTYTSQQWSWDMWGGNTIPWLNVYAGHKMKKITTFTAQKTPIYNHGLSGININFNFEVEWFFYRYNLSGETEAEDHSQYEGSTGCSISVGSNYSNFDFYAKDDYQNRAEDIVAYGRAATNSTNFECKLYDV